MFKIFIVIFLGLSGLLAYHSEIKHFKKDAIMSNIFEVVRVFSILLMGFGLTMLVAYYYYDVLP